MKLRRLQQVMTSLRALLRPALPKASDFPPGTQFFIKEFDVPLARIPGEGWVNWYGGWPSQYDESQLRVDNNWLAESFEEWVAIIEESMH